MDEFKGLISGEYSTTFNVRNGEIKLGIKALLVVADSDKADCFEHELQELFRKYAI